MTVHKSQGQTLQFPAVHFGNRAKVGVDCVALSRAASTETLLMGETVSFDRLEKTGCAHTSEHNANAGKWRKKQRKAEVAARQRWVADMVVAAARHKQAHLLVLDAARTGRAAKIHLRSVRPTFTPAPPAPAPPSGWVRPTEPFALPSHAAAAVQADGQCADDMASLPPAKIRKPQRTPDFLAMGGGVGADRKQLFQAAAAPTDQDIIAQNRRRFLKANLAVPRSMGLFDSDEDYELCADSPAWCQRLHSCLEQQHLRLQAVVTDCYEGGTAQAVCVAGWRVAAALSLTLPTSSRATRAGALRLTLPKKRSLQSTTTNGSSFKTTRGPPCSSTLTRSWTRSRSTFARAPCSATISPKTPG